MESNKNRERFVGLAEKRVSRAIKDLRLVGNLSNRSNYSYTEDDARAIFKALEKEIRGLKQRFSSGENGEKPVFKLPK